MLFSAEVPHSGSWHVPPRMVQPLVWSPVAWSWEFLMMRTAPRLTSRTMMARMRAMTYHGTSPRLFLNIILYLLVCNCAAYFSSCLTSLKHSLSATAFFIGIRSSTYARCSSAVQRVIKRVITCSAALSNHEHGDDENDKAEDYEYHHVDRNALAAAVHAILRSYNDSTMIALPDS